MAAINYSLLIDWIGTSSAWHNDAEACWIPRGAVNSAAALVDLTGNGNDLTYTNYDEGYWSAENGWAGVNGEYFDTGIVPQLEQTIYIAVTDADTLDNFATAIGLRETISATIRNHFIRMQGGSAAASAYTFEDTNYQDTRRTDAVIAINKAGFWVNGAEVSAQAITDDYTFTLNMFLGAMNLDGSPTQYLTDGHIAAVCIVNATDSDDTIKLRSYAMRNIINQNTTFPTVPIASFEDRLIWWNAKRGNDYYISPTGRGFEPKAIGRATFVLDNNDNELDPRNTSSSLYGLLEPGKLIRLRAADFPSIAYLFSGVIDDIIIDRRNKRVTLQCVDMWGWLNQKRPNVTLLENTTADVAIKAILDSVSYPRIFDGGEYTDISTGIDNIPYWWTTGKTAKEEIEDLTNSGLGFFFASGDGIPTYYNRRRFSAIPPEWTESDFEKDIRLTEPWENKRNIIDIRVTSRMEQTAATLWEYTEQKRLAPGEQFEIWANFRYDGEFVPAKEVQAPAIVFNARESGLGDDILSDLTVTTTTYADKMKIVVKNDGLVTGWLLSATITGNPIATLGTSRIEHKERGWGEQPKPLYIINDWLQNYNTANGFAQFLGDYLTRGDPYIAVRQKVDLASLFNTDKIFGHELYDIRDVDFDTLYIDGNYFIMSIEYTCGQSVNDVTATFKLQPAYNEPGTRFFRLGTSILGGSDILAW